MKNNRFCITFTSESGLAVVNCKKKNHCCTVYKLKTKNVQKKTTYISVVLILTLELEISRFCPIGVCSCGSNHSKTADRAAPYLKFF